MGSRVFIFRTDDNYRYKKLSEMLSVDCELIVEEFLIDENFVFTSFNISTKDSCIFLLKGGLLNNQSIHENVKVIWEYIETEHIPLLPIINGDLGCIKNLPENLQKLHIIGLYDSFLNQKVHNFFFTKTQMFAAIKDNISFVETCAKNNEMGNCTAKQLFDYSLGILSNIASSCDKSLAIRILSCLVGNDAFSPALIFFPFDRQVAKNIIREILDFSIEVKKHIYTLLDDITSNNNYKNIRRLIDYAELLQRIGEQLYGYNVDVSFETINNVLTPFYKKDHSIIVGIWLMEHNWEKANRMAQDRYYKKMIDCLVEIILIGESIAEICYDEDNIELLLKSYSVLKIYSLLKPEMLTHATKYKVTDDIIDNNTFRPPYSEKKRASNEIKKLTLYFQKCNFDKKEHELISRLFSTSCDLSTYKKVILDVESVLNLLVLCKGNSIKGIIDNWLINFFECIKKYIPNFSQEYQLVLIMCLSNILSLLQERYLPEKTHNDVLICLAHYFETVYDENSYKWDGTGLDKSQIYAVLVQAYEENNQLNKSDEYAIKLFTIVSARERNNINNINNLLLDIYKYASERLKKHMYNEVTMYISLGWEICNSYTPIPIELEDSYNAFEKAARDIGIK